MRVREKFGAVEHFFFTDGSKAALGCFSAFLDVSLNTFHRFQLHQEASVFTAEASAIHYSLLRFMRNEETDPLLLRIRDIF